MQWRHEQDVCIWKAVDELFTQNVHCAVKGVRIAGFKRAELCVPVSEIVGSAENNDNVRIGICLLYTSVARPKALGDIRGISYIYGIFLKFGLIEAAQKDTKKKEY